MFYIHANVATNLLSLIFELRNYKLLSSTNFNYALLGTLIIDVYWMWYFYRFLRPSETNSRKPPIQSDLTLLITASGMSLIVFHYSQWLLNHPGRNFHYSGLLGIVNFIAGIYYTHFYLASLVHWKKW